MGFVIGQRWASLSEACLGLGVVTRIEGRLLHMSFPAAAEQRTYAIDNAPLVRISYHPFDQIRSAEHLQITVTKVEEDQGLLRYVGVDSEGNAHIIPEQDLDYFVQLSAPRQRLLSYQFDSPSSFQLRVETLKHHCRLQHAKSRGLLGSRTRLLPHQIYLAHEVAKRFAPRVLLADEVGLGKTIEAGMILHAQLYKAWINRVLIVVPNNLIHQWLVEMLRRFNLHFSIFDQQRFDALMEVEGVEGNPFETEQLVLCSLDFLVNNEAVAQAVLGAKWDMLVVDEAHHLHWSERFASLRYQCIERLAGSCQGLLLLTATPEQLGIDSHFARLRLLDPARFYDLSRFKQEEAGYARLNDLVQVLRANLQTLDSASQAALTQYLGDDLQATLARPVEDIISQVIDCYGTGRVLFRNTRSALEGFPKRRLTGYALPYPDLYLDTQKQPIIEHALYPEKTIEGGHWLTHDPRVAWLQDKLKQLNPLKVLVICVHKMTAIKLAKNIEQNSGLASTIFHEDMSIIERDRAAAYFAEERGGAQVLICSEIGSEGRNFQFSRHLVLFDLPLNPDLLEQRIGRLDRIGQMHTIDIHVPYLDLSAQSVLFNWYHQGLKLFEQRCAAAVAIHQHFEKQLCQLLRNPWQDGSSFIADVARYTANMQAQLAAGRNALIEINSYDQEKAQNLIDNLIAEEDSGRLESYMWRLLDELGVKHDFLTEQEYVLNPSEHMRCEYFPGLKQEGLSVTFDRQKALKREDLTFLSWEHPLVLEAMDMVMSSEIGNTTIACMSISTLPPGTLLLETIHTINCMAPKYLQLERFFPLSPIRQLLDVSGKDISATASHQQLNALTRKIKRAIGQTLIKEVRADIEKMLQQSEHFLEARLPQIKQLAIKESVDDLSQEINRLLALKRINPSIRQEEIDFFKRQIEDSATFIDKASLQLQALRVVINT